MKRLSLLLLSATLAGCGQDAVTTQTGQSVTTAETSSAALSEADLYDRRAVFAFLQEHPAPSQQANDLFRQGVVAAQDEKQPAKARALYRKSLLLHPTAKAYYELGNLELDAQSFAGALKAYALSEALGYEPAGKLLFQMACAYAGQKEEEKALAFVEYAIEAGYTDADRLLTEPLLATVRKNYAFQSVYQEAMSGASNPETVLWQTFQRSFSDLQLPLVLNAETEKMLNKEEYISYEFEKFIPEMRGERFSRDVGMEFFYLARISRTPAYTALVYGVRNSVMGDNAPYSYVLASFDDRGKLIDKMTAGGREEVGKPFRVGTIRPNLVVEVKEYGETFEKDPAEAGYYDNKVISSELQGTRNFHIAADGRFVEDGPSLGMR